jgi:hypothetical protein
MTLICTMLMTFLEKFWNQDLGFSQQWCWTFKSSGMLYCVAEWVVLDGPKKHSAFIFRVQHSKITNWLTLRIKALCFQETLETSHPMTFDIPQDVKSLSSVSSETIMSSVLYVNHVAYCLSFMPLKNAISTWYTSKYILHKQHAIPISIIHRQTQHLMLYIH